MATLTILKFDTVDGADQMAALLDDLEKQRLITVQDAAVVTWPKDKKKPKTRQLHHMAGIGALDGAFWGLLFGVLFFIPLLGMAVGAGLGALGGMFADLGIDNSLIDGVREKLVPGTSALFLLTSGAQLDRIADQVNRRGLKFELINSNLSQEEEGKLRETFASA